MMRNLSEQTEQYSKKYGSIYITNLPSPLFSKEGKKRRADSVKLQILRDQVAPL